MYTKRLVIYLILVVLSGCATLLGLDATGHRKITILSDPPGERIEVNDGYIGTTPLEIPIEEYVEYGTFAHFYTIRALPVKGNCTNTKFFSSNDPVPETILFDTTLCPGNKEIDVNIQQTGR